MAEKRLCIVSNLDHQYETGMVHLDNVGGPYLRKEWLNVVGFAKEAHVFRGTKVYTVHSFSHPGTFEYFSEMELGFLDE